MLKYLAGVVLVFGLAFYISVQDERSTQQTAQETAQLAKSAPPTKADENHPQQNIHNPERNAPRWYRFFRWGDGTTTWVIVLTLLAIAEQAKESAKATKAMQDAIPFQQKAADAALLNAQAFINSERPWITVYCDFDNRKRTFSFMACNEGRTPANIISFTADVRCMKRLSDLPSEPEYGKEIVPTTNLLMTKGSEWSHSLVLISADDCEGYMDACARAGDKTVKFPESGERMPIFYFRVKYAAAVSDRGKRDFPVWETRACYTVSISSRDLSWCGGDKYNRYT